MEYLTITDIMVDDIIRYEDQEKPQKATIDTLRAIKEGAKVVGVPLSDKGFIKNGFTEQDNGAFRFFKAYDDSYYTGFESAWYYFDRKELKVTNEHRDGTQEYIDKFNVQYYHELQHALRSVGLNELAEKLTV